MLRNIIYKVAIWNVLKYFSVYLKTLLKCINIQMFLTSIKYLNTLYSIYAIQQAANIWLVWVGYKLRAFID